MTIRVGQPLTCSRQAPNLFVLWHRYLHVLERSRSFGAACPRPSRQPAGVDFHHGTLLADALEPRPLGLVREWMDLHLANWERARRFENAAAYRATVIGCRHAKAASHRRRCASRDYRLRLLFDDGTVGDVDFTASQWTGVWAAQRSSLLCSSSRRSGGRDRRLA